MVKLQLKSMVYLARYKGYFLPVAFLPFFWNTVCNEVLVAADLLQSQVCVLHFTTFFCLAQFCAVYYFVDCIQNGLPDIYSICCCCCCFLFLSSCRFPSTLFFLTYLNLQLIVCNICKVINNSWLRSGRLLFVFKMIYVLRSKKP